MRIAAALFQLLASVVGFISVYCWWESATLRPLNVRAQTLLKGEPDDRLFDHGGVNLILMSYSWQSRMNALAAAWTGASVLLQAVAVGLQIAWP